MSFQNTNKGESFIKTQMLNQNNKRKIRFLFQRVLDRKGVFYTGLAQLAKGTLCDNYNEYHRQKNKIFWVASSWKGGFEVIIKLTWFSWNWD